MSVANKLVTTLAGSGTAEPGPPFARAYVANQFDAIRLIS